MLNSIYIAPNYFYVFLVIKFVQLSHNAQGKKLCINCYVQLIKINNLLKNQGWTIAFEK